MTPTETDSGPDASGSIASAAAGDLDPDGEPPPCTGDPAIELIDRGAAARLDLDWLRARLADAAARIGRPVARWTVVLLDDDAMGRLHGEHTGDPATTDCLTFTLSAPGEPLEVDTAACVDEAARQAARRGIGIEAELLLYCVHSLLHGAGWDDRTPDDFAAMHAREDEILDAIGVGAVFRRGEDGAAP